MREDKQKRLERKGWRVGGAAEFLELTREEQEYIEIRLRLAEGVRRRRAERGLTQQQVAKITASSQSRVAKMEAGDPMVSIDILVRTLLALGMSRRTWSCILNRLSASTHASRTFTLGSCISVSSRAPTISLPG